MTVYLVGAGPGDPGLLTMRAAELLAGADLVVHDALVGRGVLALVSPSAELVDVGNRAGAGSELRQQDLNELLVARGRGREVVVRLKGGDPYVFGRGGEEALALEAAGIDYEVVPGVSSLAAVPAYAGVPLTMRGVASAVTVVTGHDPAEDSAIPWDALARSGATLVVLMGGARRADLASRLLDAGRRPETPVLLVESGTMPEQRSVRTTLAELGSVDIGSPTTIVVGEVAAMTLRSYEDRPLFSWRVVVTRAEDQAEEFARSLAGAGAEVVALPTIAIADPSDGGAALEKAAGAASTFDWIVFSSQNAVVRFFASLRDARSLGAARVAAIGSATAEALRARGVVADLVPLRFVDEALLEAFPGPSGTGRVLLPRAAGAREILAEGLRRQGWEVEVAEAYRTVHPAADDAALARLGDADVVTFLSSSAVIGFLEIAGLDRVPPVVASIGPVTSKTLREAGLPVTVEAVEHTSAGLLEAILVHASGREPPHLGSGGASGLRPLPGTVDREGVTERTADMPRRELLDRRRDPGRPR